MRTIHSEERGRAISDSTQQSYSQREASFSFSEVYRVQGSHLALLIQPVFVFDST